jgi:hypothetical protein
MARYLPEHGWEAIVLTPKHPRRRVTVARSREHRDYPIPLRQVADPSGASYWLQETEYRDLLLSWRKKLPRGNADQSLPGLYGREIPTDEELALEPPPEPRTALQRVAFGLRCRPDARAGWIDPALRAARAIAQSLSYDAVLAPRSPKSAQAIARAIARERKIPLINDDLSPSFDEADLLGSGERVDDARLAASPASPAPETPDRSASAPPLSPTRIVLVHAGPTAVHGRNPLIVLDAARRLLDAGRISSGGIRIRFLGARDPRLGPAIAARSLTSIVTLEPEVPWLVSLQTQAEASALLLTLGPGDGGRLPDRALEALSVRRPLLVTGSADPGVRDFLAKTQAGTFCADNTELADAIARIAEQPVVWREEGIAPYRARNVAAELARRL